MKILSYNIVLVCTRQNRFPSSHFVLSRLRLYSTDWMSHIYAGIDRLTHSNEIKLQAQFLRRCISNNKGCRRLRECSYLYRFWISIFFIYFRRRSFFRLKWFVVPQWLPIGQMWNSEGKRGTDVSRIYKIRSSQSGDRLFEGIVVHHGSLWENIKPPEPQNPQHV